MRALLVFVVSSAIVAVSMSGCQQAPLPPSASTGGSPAPSTNNPPAVGSSNPTAGQPVTVESLRSEIDELKKTVEALTTSVKNLNDLSKESANKQEETVHAVRQEVAVWQQRHRDLEKTVEMKAFRQDVELVRQEQKQFEGAIAQKDSQGRTVPKILANMQRSPEFGKEMRAAVERVLAETTHGVLIVTNKTSMRQSVKVNDIYYQIEPSATLEIQVPVGVVTFHLHQYEAPKTLFINPPKLKQEMTISWKYTSPVWTVWEPAPLLSDIRR